MHASALARNPRILARMADRQLVRIELSFVTEESPESLGDRVKESVALIVGRDALEEFRLRTMPLGKRKDHLRPVD
jgi:hypothetical protein